ncbi:MAG: hypothetical protein GY799_28180 [Desulfobulbaceae bacterium]|nr:hypothetical protein [Desulfobulbaceae bacterium]
MHPMAQSKKMRRKYVEKSRPATFEMASKLGADSIPVEEKGVPDYLS